MVSPLLTNILVGVFTAIFISLLTYFITTVTQRSTVTGLMREAFSTHTKIYHKRDISEVLSTTEQDLKADYKERITKEADRITRLESQYEKVNDALHALKLSQAWIITKMGGNPKEHKLEG